MDVDITGICQTFLRLQDIIIINILIYLWHGAKTNRIYLKHGF